MKRQDVSFYKALGVFLVMLFALLLLSSNTVNQPFNENQRIGWYLGLAAIVGSWFIARS